MYRAQYYPQLETKIYLNHAAVSPLNDPAQKAMKALIDRYVTAGSKAWTEGFQYREQARKNIAALINAAPEDIGLTQNTSTGLMMIAQEFPWEKGDRLVLVKGEFPGNVSPWLVAAQGFELEVDWLSPEDIANQTQAFHTVMAKGPKLLAISWVQYQTGFTQSLVQLSKLRETYGIQICVDGIQGIGALVMDLEKTPLDYVVCGGHKWLLGPEGTGFVYVHPDRMASLQPKLVSWLSQEDPISFLFKGSGWVDYQKPYRKNADRIEMASMSNVLYAGMAASTGIFGEVGKEKVASRITELATFARELLNKKGIPHASDHALAGIVSIPMSDERLAACIDAFEKADISIASPDGHLRIAPHFYNQEKEIEAAVTLLARLLGES